MSSSMRIMAAVAIFALTACGGDSTTQPPGNENPQTGAVSGVVQLNGQGIGSGSVTATRAGFPSRSGSPATTGAWTIGELAAGGWSLQYSPGTAHELASSENGTRTVTVQAGQTATVSAFQIQAKAPQTGLLEIHLTAGSQFSPSSVTIAPGTTVRWINDAAIDHTITPENTSQAGVWQRRTTSSAGVVFEHTFNASGQTYRYRCEPHSSSFTTGMVGVITVT